MFKFIYLLMFSIILSSCGGGGGSSSQSTPTVKTTPVTITGSFVDDMVGGVDYTTTSGITGVTDSNGHFNCKKGDQVTFSLGKVILGTQGCTEIITPASFIFKDESPEELTTLIDKNPQDYTADETLKITKLSNILKILQSLDEDGDPTNGINILPAVKNSFSEYVDNHTTGTKEKIELDYSTDQLGSGTLTEVVSSTATSVNVSLSIPTANSAISHFKNTLTKPRVENITKTILEDSSATLIKTTTFLGLNKRNLSSFMVGSQHPTKGSLSCTNGSCYYTPNANATGVDTFTIVGVLNGISSNEATVSITITPVNDAPVPSNISITTDEDTPASFTLNAFDVEGDTLTYLAMNATKGNISCTGVNCTFTPNANVFGTESVTYTVSDGSSAASGTISITITPVNDAPTSLNETVTTPEDTAIQLHPSASDVDGDTLTFVSTGFTHGTGGCAFGKCTFNPDANFNGQATWTYKVFDGTDYSPEYTMTINVTPVNDAPTSVNSTVTTEEDVSLPLNPQMSDVEGSSLSIISVSITNGEVSCPFGSCSYTPTKDFNGQAIWTYKVFDGTTYSQEYTMTINVTPVNDAPSIMNQTFNIATDSENNSIELTITDPDSSSFTYNKISDVSHGTLTCSSTCVYTPTAGYSGTDSFTVKVNDGSSESNLATVTFNVTEMLAGITTGITGKYEVGKFKGFFILSNAGENGYSTHTPGQTFEYDLSSLDTNILTLECNALMNGERNPQLCWGQGVSVGTTTFKYRIIDEDETSPWTTVTLHVKEKPVLSDDILLQSLTDGNSSTTFKLDTIRTSGDSNVTYTLSSFDSRFGPDFTLIKNGVEMMPSNSMEFLPTDLIQIKIRDNFYSGEEIIFAEITAKNSDGDVSATKLLKANGVNLSAKTVRRNMTRLMNLQTMKIEQALKLANPWKDFINDCTDTTQISDDIKHPWDTGWMFVIYKTNDIIPRPYLKIVKNIAPGVKSIITPHFEDGSLLYIPNYDDDNDGVFFNYQDYLLSGDEATEGPDSDNGLWTTMTSAAYQVWLDSIGGSLDLFGQNSQFDIDVVFSDADVQSSSITKSKFTFSDGDHNLYIKGIMQTNSGYRLTRNAICGVSNPTDYSLPSALYGEYTSDRHTNNYWMQYGESGTGYEGTGTISHADISLAWDIWGHELQVYNADDDSLYYFIGNSHRSGFDFKRNQVILSFDVSFNNHGVNAQDTLFPHHNFSINNVMRIHTFFQHELADDGNEMFYDIQSVGVIGCTNNYPTIFNTSSNRLVLETQWNIQNFSTGILYNKYGDDVFKFDFN